MTDCSPMFTIAFTVAFLGVISPVVLAVNSDLLSNATLTKAPLTLKNVEKDIEILVSSVTKMALPYLVQNSDLKLSSQCMSTFIKLFMDIRKLKVSAMKLLDSIAKPPFGMLRGSFAVMGDYDQCLDISVNKKGDVARNPKEEFYHGQYCTIQIKLPPALLEAMEDYGSGKRNITDFGKLGNIIEEFPATSFGSEYFIFHAGICMPSTCSVNDLEEIIKIIPVSFIPIRVKRCESHDAKPIISDQIVILLILAVIAVLVFTGTVLDGFFYLKYPSYNGNHKGKFIQFLLSFSFYNNTKKLLAEPKDRSGEITCINGMYFLGTLLIVIYHTYFLPFFVYFSRNISNLGHYLYDGEFTLVSTMSISIEAYFLFSGLFLVYARFRHCGKAVNVHIIKLLIRRYLRLCPSMMLIIGFILVLPLLGSGPVWADIFDVAAHNSRKWWWTYTLMYNNFLPIKDQNFLYLWFIPCLMQITIVGAILTWILSKNERFGIALIVLSGLACNITLGILTALRNYPPSYAIYFFHNREKFEETIYTSPLSHVNSFCVGMLLGYYMSRNPSLKWSHVHVTLGWIVCFLLTVGVQFILFIFHDGRDVNTVFSALYAATHKTAFSVGIAWIILACTYGYGGVVGQVLCWKGFGPLSKLGYLCYLVHYLVIAFHGSSARTPMTFTHYEIWMRICSYTTLTFFVAYVLYVTFEAPLNFIESLFLQPRTTTETRCLEVERITANNADMVKYNDIVDENPNENSVWNIKITSREVSRSVTLCDEQSRL